jgi:NIPSNAP
VRQTSLESEASVAEKTHHAPAAQWIAPLDPEDYPMMTLCIRYTLDANKLADFEAYARSLEKPVERCGGKFVAYYLPTKVAGPTNTALGLIDFPDLASYERYREQLATDAEGVESLRRAEAARCILNEDRSIMRRIPDGR